MPKGFHFDGPITLNSNLMSISADYANAIFAFVLGWEGDHYYWEVTQIVEGSAADTYYLRRKDDHSQTATLSLDKAWLTEIRTLEPAPQPEPISGLKPEGSTETDQGAVDKVNKLLDATIRIVTDNGVQRMAKDVSSKVSNLFNTVRQKL